MDAAPPPDAGPDAAGGATGTRIDPGCARRPGPAGGVVDLRPCSTGGGVGLCAVCRRIGPRRFVVAVGLTA